MAVHNKAHRRSVRVSQHASCSENDILFTLDQNNKLFFRSIYLLDIRIIIRYTWYQFHHNILYQTLKAISDIDQRMTEGQIFRLKPKAFTSVDIGSTGLMRCETMQYQFLSKPKGSYFNYVSTQGYLVGSINKQKHIGLIIFIKSSLAFRGRSLWHFRLGSFQGRDTKLERFF